MRQRNPRISITTIIMETTITMDIRIKEDSKRSLTILMSPERRQMKNRKRTLLLLLQSVLSSLTLRLMGESRSNPLQSTSPNPRTLLLRMTSSSQISAKRKHLFLFYPRTSSATFMASPLRTPVLLTTNSSRLITQFLF
jgi:hypothetical protein